jgi:hypothetical protein
VKAVTPKSAAWRTDPALSRNPKPPPSGGGVFTESNIWIVRKDKVWTPKGAARLTCRRQP